MSNLHARTIAPEPSEPRRMQESPLQTARKPQVAAATRDDVYGRTFGVPFAVWWTICLTVLVVIGVFLDAQLGR